jgi:hypothetical protein
LSRTLALGGVLLVVWPRVSTGLEDDLTLRELAGRYTSSENGGCTLRLEARGTVTDGSFTLICRDLWDEGQARLPSRSSTLLLLLPFRRTGSAWQVSYAAQERERPGAPPPVIIKDPTRPLIRQPRANPGLQPRLLHVVSWGSRVYLVRAETRAEFCLEVKERVEPRRVPEGTAFLRVGDHAKPVPPPEPGQCEAWVGYGGEGRSR